MKIREILLMTQEKKLEEIAKEHLTIGYRPAKEALRNAGCYAKSGVKGWHYDGDEAILEMSIYDFASIKPTANVKTNKTKNLTKNIDSKQLNNVDSKHTTNEGIIETTNEETTERKRASFDIDKNLLKQLKVKSVMEDRNMYEILEDAIRDYLNK